MLGINISGPVRLFGIEEENKTTSQPTSKQTKTRTLPYPHQTIFLSRPLNKPDRLLFQQYKLYLVFLQM